MASITVMSATNDRLLSNNHTSIMSSSPSSGSNSPTTYLLLTTTTSSEAKPVAAKSSIAPKRSNLSASSSSQSTTSVLRAKRKIQFATGGERHPAPPAVARRNERERNRVRQVNMGFATLRQHVPNGTKSKKMSKVETLRSAVQYIKQLQQLLDETGHSDNGDENSAPSFEDVAQLSSSHLHHPHQHQLHHPNNQISENFGLIGVTSPPYSAASSPTPSLGSDASSPYGDSLSPEDEDLLDWCLNI